MEELVTQIKADFDSFIKDVDQQVEKGNKAAGARARRMSVQLEKLLKSFRKASVAVNKKE